MTNQEQDEARRAAEAILRRSGWDYFIGTSEHTEVAGMIQSAIDAEVARQTAALREALALYADRSNWARGVLMQGMHPEVDVWYAPIPPWEPALAALGGASGEAPRGR